MQENKMVKNATIEAFFAILVRLVLSKSAVIVMKMGMVLKGLIRVKRR
jgi:dihydrodipicolinate synthase/N-acetylneuraminate lyase